VLSIFCVFTGLMPMRLEDGERYAGLGATAVRRRTAIM
jgi:hypothetical protein